MSSVRCNFILRTPNTANPGTHDLEPIDIEGPDGGPYRTPHPPMIGDTIWLIGAFDNHQGAQYRVLARNWLDDDGLTVDCLLEPAQPRQPETTPPPADDTVTGPFDERLRPGTLLAAARELTDRYPGALLVKNQVGNLAILDAGERYIGFLDLRTGIIEITEEDGS